MYEVSEIEVTKVGQIPGGVRHMAEKEYDADGGETVERYGRPL